MIQVVVLTKRKVKTIKNLIYDYQPTLFNFNYKIHI